MLFHFHDPNSIKDLHLSPKKEKFFFQGVIHFLAVLFTVINSTTKQRMDNKDFRQKESCDVIVSARDDRAYRHITLPNKLEVLLISDPSTEKVIS
jgi:hypothetical protein